MMDIHRNISESKFFQVQKLPHDKRHSPTSTRALGILSVSGLRRVPLPAAKTMALRNNILLGFGCIIFFIICRQYRIYFLLSVAYSYFHAEFLVEMFGKMLRSINAAVLTTRTSEREHYVGKAALHVANHVRVCKFVHTVEEF